ncbi:hypothetical protein pb186bvf_017224 [Paramecium bursaria]
MQQEIKNGEEYTEQKVAYKPKVIFILGVPCSGKGTLCQMIQQKYHDKVVHLSAGDLLRAERNEQQSQYGQLINDYIKEGKIVPSAITVQLIKNAMTIKGLDKFFLIDGFPRNQENLQSWNEILGPTVDVLAVLNLVCSFETLWNRLCLRKEEIGRIDDNEETLKKRLATHNEQTMPIIQLFEDQKKTFSISTETSKREDQNSYYSEYKTKQISQMVSFRFFFF